MNFITIFKLIRPHLKLAFSWRFIVATLLFAISAAWLVVCYLPNLKFLELTINSLPTYVYVLILIAFLLAIFFALGKSPVEYWLLKRFRLAINDLRHEDIDQYLLDIEQPSFLFMLPTSYIQLVRLKVSFYRRQGGELDAYDLLEKVQKLPLLPKEAVEVQVQLLHLYYAVGNIKACQQVVTKLQSLKLTFDQQLNVDLQQVELDTLAGKYQQAKDKLEELFANPQLSVDNKVAVLHTLAVVDTHLRNYESVTTAYRQAWDLQKHQINNFAQAERTIDNLILTYAKQNELAKIQPVLKELEALACDTSQTQQLALHNIKIKLARQLNNRALLLQTYEEAEQNLLSRLEGEQKFAYIVNGLRMHFNDNVNFEQALQDTQHAMLTKPAISTIHNLRAITEVSGTLKQAITIFGLRPDLMTFLSWLLFEFKRLTPELDSLQNNVKPNLPAPKAELISLKVESLKNELLLMHAQPSKALFTKMFELLAEKKKLWRGMNNPLDQLEALLVILDEYRAYNSQLSDQKFEADFKPIALNALEEAAQLVNNNPKHLAYSDKLIGLAYACYQLNTHKAQAKQLLDTFDQTKLSLNHNAAWLRDQYMQTKGWVTENESIDKRGIKRF